MGMNSHDFDQARRFAVTPMGRIAYVECGAGPAALFLHGFPLNGFHWRGTLDDLSGIRRCIALDLMGLGHSEVAADQSLTFEDQARMVAAFLDKLEIEQADLVGNDTGGGVSQLVAAHFPSRVRTLTLTNCEVHDLWPNATLRALFDSLGAEGAMAGLKALVQNPAMARRAFATAYENVEQIPAEAFRVYLEPVLSTDERALNVQRFVRAAQIDRDQMVAAAPMLRQLRAPAQVIWGDADTFFDVEPSLNWLKANVPSIKKVIAVPRARLFFPEEHPRLISVLLREFWNSAL